MFDGKRDALEAAVAKIFETFDKARLRFFSKLDMHCAVTDALELQCLLLPQGWLQLGSPESSPPLRDSEPSPHRLRPKHLKPT